MTTPTPQPPASDMTLRDWFAGQALSGLLHPDNIVAANKIACNRGVTVQRTIATVAYEYADAMMEARKV